MRFAIEFFTQFSPYGMPPRICLPFRYTTAEQKLNDCEKPHPAWRRRPRRVLISAPRYHRRLVSTGTHAFLCNRTRYAVVTSFADRMTLRHGSGGAPAIWRASWAIPAKASREEIEPEALARLVGWKVTLRQLALRMRCSRCDRKAAEIVAVGRPRPRGWSFLTARQRPAEPYS